MNDHCQILLNFKLRFIEKCGHWNELNAIGQDRLWSEVSKDIEGLEKVAHFFNLASAEITSKYNLNDQNNPGQFSHTLEACDLAIKYINNKAFL